MQVTLKTPGSNAAPAGGNGLAHMQSTNYMNFGSINMNSLNVAGQSMPNMVHSLTTNNMREGERSVSLSESTTNFKFLSRPLTGKHQPAAPNKGQVSINEKKGIKKLIRLATARDKNQSDYQMM